jgi:hypothetical protein
LAWRLVDKFHRSSPSAAAAGVEHVNASNWSNALNLCTRSKKTTEDQLVALGDVLDYFCISTNIWNPPKVKALTTASEEEQFAAITDQYNSAIPGAPIIVYVYAAFKDDGGDQGIEQLLLERKVSLKQRLIEKKMKEDPAAAAAAE